MQRTLQPRAAAALVLERVLRERLTLDEAWSGEEDPFTRNLVLSTLRHIGQIDAVLEQYIEKPLPEKCSLVQQALRLGVAQLLVLKTPPHAAVNETVEQVKQGPHAKLSGMANAVLKRVANETSAFPSAEYNIPSWLKGRWRKFYGKDEVAKIAEIAAARPPLDLNLPAPAQMPVGARLDDEIWRLPADHPLVIELPGFTEGTFFVQDIAAGLPVRMLGDVAGKEVLDLAAAPGGKSMQLARAGAAVTALDKSEKRLQKLRDNMQRTKMNVQIISADILQWNNDKLYDAVLLDAPCSATGTWRRHPEVLLLTCPTDIPELAARQRAMLERAWGWVKPGGKLLYCVCSMEPEEGEDVAAWFATTYNMPVAAQRRTLPHEIEGGQDGFFMALFEKMR